MPPIEALRNRQVKNLLALNLIALGTPMLLMGDEVAHAARQQQRLLPDDETSWFDWRLLERHGDVRRFAEHLIAARPRRAPTRASA
jgi:glycogen operon protein